MEAQQTPTPKPRTSPDEGTTALLHLPARREAGEPFTQGELRDIAATARAFLASPSNKSGPGKKILWNAVNALLKHDSRALSKGWDKTQLASVLLRWSQVALGMPSQDLQGDLTVQVLSCRKKTKQLSHKIYLLDEATDTAETFQIDSPSPVRPPQGVRASSAREKQNGSLGASPEATSSGASCQTPTTDLNESFSREINELANEYLLAAIPAIHTPRVSEENFRHEPENVSGPQGPKDGPAPDGVWSFKHG